MFLTDDQVVESALAAYYEIKTLVLTGADSYPTYRHWYGDTYKLIIPKLACTRDWSALYVVYMSVLTGKLYIEKRRVFFGRVSKGNPAPRFVKV